jgi:hypothetical protein
VPKDKKRRNQQLALRNANKTISSHNNTIRDLKSDNIRLRELVNTSKEEGIDMRQRVAESMAQAVCTAHLLQQAVYLLRDDRTDGEVWDEAREELLGKYDELIKLNTEEENKDERAT